MSSNELLGAAQDGDADQVTRMLEETGVKVDSKDKVSVCVLCLLILVLFGIVWNDGPY